jgi:hypothetical protein
VHAVGVGRRRGGLGSEGLLLRLSPRQYDLWVKRLLLLLLLVVVVVVPGDERRGRRAEDVARGAEG